MTVYIDAATYGRNSDRKQETSQAIQADVFQHFAEDGFTKLFGKPARITENYKDHGKSASKRKSRRADFDRMLNDAAIGKVKIVLVLNTSRFARLHPVDALKFLTTFRDSGAHLVSIEDHKIIQIEELGDLITTIVKFNAEHELARTIASNTLRGTILQIKTEATSHVAHIPYGMAKLVITDTDGQKVYPRSNNVRIAQSWRAYLVAGDDTECEIVLWMFTTYLADDISFMEIARRLNNHDNAVVRRGPTGKGWCDRTVIGILRNRHYRAQEFIGARQQGEHFRAVDGQAVKAKEAKNHKPLVVDGKYAPVVPVDVFEQVQAKMERNKGRKPKCDGTEGYSLTGSLV